MCLYLFTTRLVKDHRTLWMQSSKMLWLALGAIYTQELKDVRGEGGYTLFACSPVSCIVGRPVHLHSTLGALHSHQYVDTGQLRLGLNLIAHHLTQHSMNSTAQAVKLGRALNSGATLPLTNGAWWLSNTHCKTAGLVVCCSSIKPNVSKDPSCRFRSCCVCHHE